MARIIQPLVIVSVAVVFQGMAWPVLAKFAVVGSLSIVVMYAAAGTMRLSPPVRRALG